MFSNKINYKLLNITALMLLLYIGFSNLGLWWTIFVKIVSVLAPFIIAFVFAYAFTPIVKFLENRGIRKGLAVTIVVLAIILLVGGLLAISLPTIYDQFVLFAKMIMEAVQNVSTKFNLNLGGFELKLTDFFNSSIKQLGNLASSTTMDVISKSLNFLGKFVVSFVAFIYFLADMKNIRSWVKRLFLSINTKSFNYIKCIDAELGNYIKGLVIFMLIQLVEYSLVYFIIGHPNWLILGILACLTAIIPYFGGLITNLIALVTASIVSPGVFIATIIVCLIFPQLDGYFTSPKVYGKTNNVNPLITIMAVSVGGTIAGVPGIIVALPVYLLIRATYEFFEKDLKKGMVIVKKTI